MELAIFPNIDDIAAHPEPNDESDRGNNAEQRQVTTQLILTFKFGKLDENLALNDSPKKISIYLNLFPYWGSSKARESSIDPDVGIIGRVGKG